MRFGCSGALEQTMIACSVPLFDPPLPRGERGGFTRYTKCENALTKLPFRNFLLLPRRVAPTNLTGGADKPHGWRRQTPRVAPTNSKGGTDKLVCRWVTTMRQNTHKATLRVAPTNLFVGGLPACVRTRTRRVCACHPCGIRAGATGGSPASAAWVPLAACPPVSIGRPVLPAVRPRGCHWRLARQCRSAARPLVSAHPTPDLGRWLNADS